MTSPPPAALRRIADYQRHAWFAAGDPRVLAIGRVLIFGYVWPGFGGQDYADFAHFASSAWYSVSFFKTWSVPLLDGPSLQALAAVSWIALACAAIGFAYRVSAPVAALTALYLHGIPQSFGKVNHAENVLMLALFVFAFARAADAWSVDAWIRARRTGEAARADVVPSGAHRWPLRFVALMVVTMYTAAGCSKLMNSGWDWALSGSFRRLLLRHHLTHTPPTEVGVWLASMPAVCQALALGALLTELAAPLALFGRRPFAVMLSALFALQTAIWLVLGVKFSSMLPLFLCLLPWERLLALTLRTRVRSSPTVAAE